MMLLIGATMWIVMGATTNEMLLVAGYEIDSGICGIQKVPPPTERIVGGFTSKPGSWPWQAMIQTNGISDCGAVLISEEYLLTAAHCVFSDENLTFHLGAYRIDATDGTAVEVQVHVIVCHPDYNPFDYSNDICMIKLVKPIDFTDYIQPVCLPKEGSRVDVGEQVTITGWANIANEGSLPEHLQEAQVLVLNTTTCQSWYYDQNDTATIPESHFCAGYEQGGIDTCGGDSGGPLVHEEKAGNTTAYVLRGITSFGAKIGCGLPYIPGVYVNVSEFTPWIENKMTDSSGPYCQATSNPDCGGVISSEDVIRSPTSTGSFDYPPNQICTWNIIAPKGYEIHFEFVCYFMLSPPGFPGQADYVEIIDSGGKGKNFTGNEIPSPYVVVGGNASFTFITDGKFNYPGFVTKVSFVNTIPTTVVPSTSTHDITGDEDTDTAIMATTSRGAPLHVLNWNFIAIVISVMKVSSFKF